MEVQFSKSNLEGSYSCKYKTKSSSLQYLIFLILYPLKVLCGLVDLTTINIGK